MPFSNLEQITPILAEIRKDGPSSILDVGCGLGVYGFLCRIYLELYDDKNFMEKLEGSRPWDVKIDALEGFRDYLRFVPRWVYDEIIVDSALDAIAKIPDKAYDLVLAIAILEHFCKEEGTAFVTELKRIGKKIILTVPKDWREQSVSGNPYETHRSQWSFKELVTFGFNTFLPHPQAWIAVYQ